MTFLLPDQGSYNIRVNSQRYEVEPVERAHIDHNQTLRLHALERNTWIVDASSGMMESRWDFHDPECTGPQKLRGAQPGRRQS